MSRVVPRLHVVTNDRVVAQPDFVNRVTEIALGPDVAIHLRARMSGAQFVRLGDQLQNAVAPTGTLLIINDRVDAALVIGAAGTHLPESGLPARDARSVLGGAALVGRSVHDLAHRNTDPDTDYLMLGAIYSTTTHPDRQPSGVRALRQAGRTPVIAIGGVTPERTPECLAAGAHGVATISAVWDASEPAAAVRSFLLSLT